MRLYKWHTLIWGSLFLLTVGFVLHIYQLFVMAAALGLLAPVSCALTRINLRNLKVSRRMPRRTVAGESIQVTLTIHNPTARRRFLFTVPNPPPPGL